MTTEPDQQPSFGKRLREIALLFLKLGTLGFGGPAAHIALMEEEVVTRRRWMSRDELLELVALTHLIPGPNSTEMAIHLGAQRAGFPGMLVAGACFIGPAVTITLVCAWLYVTWGTVPEIVPFLIGIKPAVLVIIFAAVWKLGRSAVKGWKHAVIGLAVALVSFSGSGEVTALLVGGIGGTLLLVRSVKAKPRSGGAACLVPVAFLPLIPAPAPWAQPDYWKASVGASMAWLSAMVGATSGGVSLWKLGLFFLQVGSVLYGGGYVLVAFLEGELLQVGGWISETQLLQENELLDAIAIGQFTPGPILSTATFVGYVIAGVPGALVATVGIFLPSFVFVFFLQKLLRRLKRGVWMQAFLGAVKVGAVGLMCVAGLRLGRLTLVDVESVVVAILAAVALLRFRVHPAWIVVGGALFGWIFSHLF